MCERLARFSDPAVVAREFQAELIERWSPSWNVAPTGVVPAVVMVGGRRVLVTHRWGIVPAAAPDTTVASRYTTARVETVWEHNAYSDSVRRRRCLVPVDGYYDFVIVPGGRLPKYLRPRKGGLLALAGMWESWRSPIDGSELRTVAIVTVPANRSLAAHHERMPVVLSERAQAIWLAEGTNIRPLRPLLVAAPEDLLVAHRVSSRVGNEAVDEPGLIDPVAA